MMKLLMICNDLANKGVRVLWQLDMEINKENPFWRMPALMATAGICKLKFMLFVPENRKFSQL